jgi:kinesin family protein C2/C3
MMGTSEMRGVNLRALRELFRICSERDDYDYTISVGFIEIYNEQIRDLLDSDPDKKPEVRQGPNGNFVDPLLEETVSSEAGVLEVINKGHTNRTVAATAMNSESSRSHSLILIRVEGVNKFTKAKSTGKLTLVDLAGSERQKKSEASGQRLTEAAAINKSLSALGNVIAALQAGQSHVPFRNSKLTHLLSDSLGGNAKVLMFLALSPSADNSEETLNSLQFGSRVRNVTLGTATANNDANKGKGKGKGGKGKGKKKLPPTK